MQQPLTEGMIAYVGAYIAIVGEDGMDRALQNGNQSSDGTTADDTMTLEAVELEFALGAIDVLIEGFDSALAKAAERVGGEVLFNMPALDTSEAQRIGAIAIAGQPEDQVIFVTLRNDGTTLSVEPPTGENAVFESLGRNYAAVMKSLSPKEKVNGARTELFRRCRLWNPRMKIVWSDRVERHCRLDILETYEFHSLCFQGHNAFGHPLAR